MLKSKAVEKYIEFKKYCANNGIDKVSLRQVQSLCDTLFVDADGCTPGKFMQLYNQRDKCFYCDSDMIIINDGNHKTHNSPKYATMDHVIPKSKGYGLMSDYSNMVICCRSCNSKKGDRNVFAFMAAKNNIRKSNVGKNKQPSLLTNTVNDIILFVKVFLGATKCY